MTRRTAKLTVVLFLYLPVSLYAQPSFSQTAKFCPITMSYSDLARVVGRIHEFLIRANGGEPTAPYGDRVTLEGARRTFELANDFSAAALSQGPDPATDVRYSFSGARAPITEVLLRLGDYSRTLTVSGTDRTQVEVLSTLVSGDMDAFGCAFGGSGRRLFGGGVLLVIGFVMVMVGLDQSLAQLSTRARLGLVTFGVAVIVVLVRAPWDEWLPGASVRIGDASFMARHGPLIGFVGTAVGVVSLIISIAPAIRRMTARREEQSPPPPAT